MIIIKETVNSSIRSDRVRQGLQNGKYKIMSLNRFSEIVLLPWFSYKNRVRGEFYARPPRTDGIYNVFLDVIAWGMQLYFPKMCVKVKTRYVFAKQIPFTRKVSTLKKHELAEISWQVVKPIPIE